MCIRLVTIHIIPLPIMRKRQFIPGSSVSTPPNPGPAPLMFGNTNCKKGKIQVRIPPYSITQYPAVYVYSLKKQAMPSVSLAQRDQEMSSTTDTAPYIIHVTR